MTDMRCKAAFCIFGFAVDTEDAMESLENDPNFMLRRLTRRQRPKLKGSLLRKDVDSRVFIYLFDICIPQSQVLIWSRSNGLRQPCKGDVDQTS